MKKIEKKKNKLEKHPVGRYATCIGQNNFSGNERAQCQCALRYVNIHVSLTINMPGFMLAAIIAV